MDVYKPRDGRRFELQRNGVRWQPNQEGERIAAVFPLSVTARSIRGIRALDDEEADDDDRYSRPYLPVRPANALAWQAGRRSGELWIRLLHNDSQAVIARDAALFTIAPFLLCSNVDPVHAVYTVRTNPPDRPEKDNTPWLAS
jgi:hypothetical protein